MLNVFDMISKNTVVSKKFSVLRELHDIKKILEKRQN